MAGFQGIGFPGITVGKIRELLRFPPQDGPQISTQEFPVPRFQRSTPRKNTPAGTIGILGNGGQERPRGANLASLCPCSLGCGRSCPATPKRVKVRFQGHLPLKEPKGLCRIHAFACLGALSGSASSLSRTSARRRPRTASGQRLTPSRLSSSFS